MEGPSLLLCCLYHLFSLFRIHPRPKLVLSAAAKQTTPVWIAPAALFLAYSTFLLSNKDVTLKKTKHLNVFFMTLLQHPVKLNPSCHYVTHVWLMSATLTSGRRHQLDRTPPPPQPITSRLLRLVCEKQPASRPSLQSLTFSCGGCSLEES